MKLREFISSNKRSRQQNTRRQFLWRRHILNHDQFEELSALAAGGRNQSRTIGNGWKIALGRVGGMPLCFSRMSARSMPSGYLSIRTSRYHERLHRTSACGKRFSGESVKRELSFEAGSECRTRTRKTYPLLAHDSGDVGRRRGGRRIGYWARPLVDFRSMAARASKGGGHSREHRASPQCCGDEHPSCGSPQGANQQRDTKAALEESLRSSQSEQATCATARRRTAQVYQPRPR